MQEAHLHQSSPDEHVFIVVECPGRPTISIDITNQHGRRSLGVRLDGMGVADMLVDLKELPTKGETMFRYCQMCGNKLQLLSSRPHKCEER